VLGPERGATTNGWRLSAYACGAYARNDWWLPDAYVNNATCACQTTPDEPRANCVRKVLQARLAATPGSVKTMAQTRASTACGTDGNVQDLALAPRSTQVSIRRGWPSGHDN
jgi:hypothetical protein